MNSLEIAKESLEYMQLTPDEMGELIRWLATRRAEKELIDKLWGRAFQDVTALQRVAALHYYFPEFARVNWQYILDTLNAHGN